MKRKLTLLSLFLACLSFYVPVRASHFIGAEIGYAFIAPGVVVAEVKGYFDCVATTPPSATLPVTIKSAGCSNGQTVMATRQTSYQRSLDPYCSTMGNGCGGSSGRLNWQEARYVATITLPAQCSEWVLSFQDCTKPPVTNLVSPGPNCIYLEAYINTAVGQPISPEFYPMPTYLVTVNSPATILNLVANRGGADSLAYALKPAMQDANNPAVYKPNFTFANFIPSATGVELHPKTGLLSFTPNVYNQVIGYDANAYTFVVEATAFKKLNGVMTKVSSTQRNIQVLVENLAPNQNPDITNVLANGTPVQPNDIVEVVAGNPLVLQFEATDANASDSVSVVKPDPANPYMAWSIFYNSNGAAKPTSTFTWLTNLAIPGEHFYFPIIVQDNSCPIPGKTTRMFGIKVVSPTGVKKNLVAHNSFTAFPNPFTQEVNFKVKNTAKAQSIQISNLLGQPVDRIQIPVSAPAEVQIAWEKASQFAAGTYVARLISEGQATQLLKFTKIR